MNATPTIDAPAETAQQRLERAHQQFQNINRSLPAGVPPFQLPPFLEQTAALDALVTTLIDAGIVDSDRFVGAKVERMAEIVQDLTEQARDAKKQLTGLLLAAPGQMPKGRGVH